MATKDYASQIKEWKESQDGFPLVLSRGWGGDKMRKSNPVRDHMKEILCMDIVAAYLEQDVEDSALISKIEGQIDLDGLDIVVVLRNGRILKFSNSEWGGISTAGNYLK